MNSLVISVLLGGTLAGVAQAVCNTGTANSCFSSSLPVPPKMESFDTDSKFKTLCPTAVNTVSTCVAAASSTCTATQKFPFSLYDLTANTYQQTCKYTYSAISTKLACLIKAEKKTAYQNCLTTLQSMHSHGTDTAKICTTFNAAFTCYRKAVEADCDKDTTTLFGKISEAAATSITHRIGCSFTSFSDLTGSSATKLQTVSIIVLLFLANLQLLIY